jgi:hypothetical protein
MLSGGHRQVEHPFCPSMLVLRICPVLQGIYLARDKPLKDVNNQEHKKCVASKSEVDLKVPDHNPANRHTAVINDAVCELKAREDAKAQKVEGSCCGPLQIANPPVDTMKLV